MYNNQELLKKHTALTISRKDVDTSFIMFPVRIETRFSKSHPVEDISEPDRILYAFQALWHYVECLRVGEDEEIVLRVAKKLMEKVDLLRQIDESKRLPYAVTTMLEGLILVLVLAGDLLCYYHIGFKKSGKDAKAAAAAQEA